MSIAATGSQSPLHVQIERRIQWSIERGEYAEGESLPSASALSADFRANKNTVLRALRNLRAKGLVDFGRGRGIIVIARSGPGHTDVAGLSDQLRQLVAVADAHGVARSSLISAIERMPRPAEGAAPPRGAGKRPRA
ncbi:GntR family transcriptional regulator [Kitasatospora sp. NPDC101157]|uniref:GntR family transcriptional regulator n=1 Tax=Kitasatospora sp. NPDC101157 TaxID=3364098 RepID=UPI00382E7F60